MKVLKIFGKFLKNLEIYQKFQEIGFDYILNPKSGEIHIVADGNFFGSHNLQSADLENFIGLTNLGTRLEFIKGKPMIPVYDLITGELLGEFKLEKCAHCFKQS